MTPFFPVNAKVLRVERKGALDRYGQPQYETVESNLNGNLDQSTRLVRTLQGDAVTVDGSIMLHEPLETGDLLTMDDQFQSKWAVFTKEQANDFVGDTLFWTYTLTKQRGQDAAS